MPEAILYGKTADAHFIGRIGEHIDDWKRMARRRAWARLLQQVAELLDGASIRVEVVAQKIVEFSVDELEIDDAFVRTRLANGLYKLAAKKTKVAHVDEEKLLDIEQVPIFQLIVAETRNAVVREQISKQEAGKFKQYLTGRRFLGVGAVLGERNVGFITLLRKPERPSFDSEVDGPYLSVLARLLASALRVEALRKRQTRLLKFADDIGLATDGCSPSH